MRSAEHVRLEALAQHGAQVRRRAVFAERAVRHDAGVVNKDVEAAEMRRHIGDGGVDGGIRGDVELQGGGTGVGERGGGGFAFRERTAAKEEVVAGKGGELLGDGEANTLGRRVKEKRSGLG